MTTRRHSAGSRSIGGYISDGQASGVSSGNEDTGICSEVMGCIQGYLEEIIFMLDFISHSLSFSVNE